MKKFLNGLLALLLMLPLTACSGSKETSKDIMEIKPSVFSEETMQVLDLFKEDITFFDFTVNETIKSYSINVWIYDGNEWLDQGASSGNIDQTDNQIAIQIEEIGYHIFTIDENGYVKYSSPETNISFDHTTLQLSNRITNPTPIIVDKEIPLWVQISNDGNHISIPDDFRKSDCTAGFAVTVTFSDNALK